MLKDLNRLPLWLMFADGDQGDNGGDSGKTGDGDKTGTGSTSSDDGDKTGDKGGDGKAFTQADVDRIVEDRLARDRKARTPKPAPPKPKATPDAGDGDKGDKGGDGDNGQTELEARLAELEAERDEARAAATRSTVAEAKEVPAALLAGPTDGTKEALEKWADQLIEWRGKVAKPRPSSPAIGRTNGTASTKAPVGRGLARIRAGYDNK